MSRRQQAWTAAWTTSPQQPSVSFAPNWSTEGFTDQTIRQTVRLSVGGDALRVRLSNRYGAVPLQVAGLTIAIPASGAAVKPDTLREMTVDGAQRFSVPAGADRATDALRFPTDALETVTVTLYLAETSGLATYHAQALTTTYRAPGDHRADIDGTAFTETSQSWYYINAVDVTGASDDGIVVFGDSLTDGTGSTPDTDRRFPDLLAERFVTAGRPRAVLNQGIGGNRVTIDSAWLGDRATARFRHDVLTHPGVSTVLILTGTNDIVSSEVGQRSPIPILAPYAEVSAEQIIAGLQEMLRCARAAGLRTVGATLLPIRGSVFSTPRSEAKRAAVNAWIRESKEYDAVIDFARVVGDALDPGHDSGDHLHPNDAGYEVMAAAIDLALL